MEPRLVQNPAEIEAYWPFAAPWLERAIDVSGGPVAWRELGVIKSGLMRGFYQLWTAEDPPGEPLVYLVTEVYEEAGERVLALRWVGGHSMEKWLSCLQGIEKMAAWNGVSAVEVYGRKGWERALARSGYSFEAIVLRKRLPVSQTLQ